MQDEIRGATEEETLAILEPATLSICPKVRRSRPVVSSHPNLGWIQALWDFDNSRPEARQLQDYLAKFDGVVPSESDLA
jgi:hypothetical protein